MPAPAAGGAAFKEGATLIMRLARKGCTNRPFYHVVIQEAKWEQYDPCIEQLGAYDPLPNKYNEKLVSLNFERIRYWLGRKDVYFSKAVGQLFGLCGFFPIHPSLYEEAWKERRKALEPEQPLPSKLTWRHRKKILLQEAEDAHKKRTMTEPADAGEGNNKEQASSG